LELLTGQRPTDPTQRPAVLYARMRRCLPAEAPAVSDASCDWGAGAATDLGSLAKRCVAAEADDRPGMEEVLEMLDGMQEGLARTGPGVVKPPICVRWHHAWDTMQPSPWQRTFATMHHYCCHLMLATSSSGMDSCHTQCTAMPPPIQFLPAPGPAPGEAQSECVVCMDAPRNTRLRPCLHNLLCEQCAEQLVQRRATCPTCRTSIQEFDVGTFNSTYAPD
jgi:hypothetical protein